MDKEKSLEACPKCGNTLLLLPYATGQIGKPLSILSTLAVCESCGKKLYYNPDTGDTSLKEDK